MNHVPTNVSARSSAGGVSYLTGFILAMALTALAFGLVIKRAELPRWVIMVSICGAALAQVAVHLHYFLHLDASPSKRWNVLALLFTVLIAILFIGGTIWVMTDLNMRMM